MAGSRREGKVARGCVEDAQGEPRVIHCIDRHVTDADDADFEARSRSCTVLLSKAEPCAVMGVPQLLRSAVENVVRNAVRYTTPGTAVEITLQCELVDEKRTAVITVRDHGSGVPEEKLAAIFRPFYRVADARDRKTGGTGLGLAIASRAVRVHQGTISALNAPGGGLIVEIRIPASFDQARDPDVEPASPVL